MDLKRDEAHSEMFSCAIKLALALGAKKVWVEPDIKTGSRKHHPDVLGGRGSQRSFLIIEREKEQGRILDKQRPVDSYSVRTKGAGDGVNFLGLVYTD